MLAFVETLQSKDDALSRILDHLETDAVVRPVTKPYPPLARLYQEFANGPVDTADDLYPLSETVHGIPEQIAQLADSISEGLPEAESAEWLMNFIDVMPEGADLSRVWHQFAAWLLIDRDTGIIRFADERGRIVIKVIARLHRRAAAGDEPSPEEWEDAREAAKAAAWEAVRATAWDTAWAASWTTVKATVWAAAWDAVDTPGNTGKNTESDAKKTAYHMMGARLIRLVIAAPVQDRAA